MANMSTLRRGLYRVWIAASLLWTAGALFVFPVQDAFSALWNDAPTAEEMQAQVKALDRAYSECLLRPPSPAESENAAAVSAMHTMNCNMMKLQLMPAGLTREVAWGRMSDYFAGAVLGSFGIGLLLFLGAWVAKGFR